jgi:hypothetical protein
MACCAAAAFFLSQIALALESVRRRLFGARVRETARNDAVAWTLGAPAPVPTTKRRTRRLIAGALVAEALLIAGSATAWTTYGTSSPVISEQTLWSLAMDSICTGGPLEQSRERLTNWIEGKQP